MPVREPGDGVTADVSAAFTTRDIDHARSRVCASYYPLALDPVGSTSDFALEMRTVRLDRLVLGTLRYDAAVRKDCGELTTSYHVNVPVRGMVASTCGEQQVVCTPSTAAVFDPVGRTVLDEWTAGTTQLCLKIDRELVNDELENRLGRPLPSPARFRMGMNLATAAGRTWLQALRLLAAELDAPGGLTSEPLLAGEVQRLIVGGLLWGQAHSYSEELRAPAPAPRPRTVKLAMDAIAAHPEHPWTVGELAEAAGIGIRSLEDGFRRYLGRPPTAHLRDVRLDRARDDLAAAAPETTVGEVAYRWGFTHLGRFARAYGERFGEAPSTTLRYRET